MASKMTIAASGAQPGMTVGVNDPVNVAWSTDDPAADHATLAVQTGNQPHPHPVALSGNVNAYTASTGTQRFIFTVYDVNNVQLSAAVFTLTVES